MVQENNKPLEAGVLLLMILVDPGVQYEIGKEYNKSGY